jgi:two-component system sensor histidine kinase UhpB
MALGHVPLHDILGELVRDRARQHPHAAFAFTAGRLMPSYGDSIDLTVYRCIQESLTNVIRHAQAKEVAVVLGEASGDDGVAAGQLLLTVRDDGAGFDASAPPGFGIRGMQERVHALGGSYKLESGAGRGTCARIAIPLPGATAAS